MARPGARALVTDGHWVASVETGRPPDADEVAARLWLVGALGVQVLPRRVDGWFDDRPDELEERVAATLDASVSWRFEPARDHLAAWRASVEPIDAGPFDIVPRHLAEDHPGAPGRLRIVLDPGQAFGSGHHDTTAGCLEALADPAATPPTAGARVLDVGTGTAILAIGAVLLGAVEVVGVDTDEHAIAVARQNVADNLANRVGDSTTSMDPDDPRVGVDTIRLVVGSLGVVDGTFDVVVANLLTHTIVALADGLLAATRPGGRLIASGIGRERAEVATSALRDAGFIDVATRPRGDWAILTAHRPDDAATPGPTS